MAIKGVSYINLVDELNIRPGEIVYLSSGLLKLMWLCQKNAESFDANLLIDKLQDTIGSNGTLLIPTYNFDFNNRGLYNFRQSMSTVGYLGNVALKRKDFRRTKHPIHSFAVWGKDQKLLCSLDNINSFGEDSPFNYLLENKAIEIGIGIEYVQAFTFIHFIEVRANVPYRFIKKFRGTYLTENGNVEIREYDYPARDRCISYKTQKEGLALILEQNGAAIRKNIFDIDCYRIDLAKAYQNIYFELTMNKAKNIFDFSIDRDYLFSSDFKISKD